MRLLATIASILVLIGALNWGLIGFFNYDLFGHFFSGQALRIVQDLVGISAVLAILGFLGLKK
ncbi:MAG: DUF378 domain-containing protein [Alphaproteobacteria bacterium]|nr:DUF378 domain-containing protein [Alphaproteobacteria bacterium]